MALQGIPSFGNAQGATSAVATVKAEQLAATTAEDVPLLNKHFAENDEQVFESQTCAVEHFKTESSGMSRGESPVATSANTAHLKETNSGSSGNDGQPSSRGTASSPNEVTSLSSSPPGVAVALHFVGATSRSCAHCRTVKTPLWRNGPMGPKTLCNACGIRFKLGKLQVGSNDHTLVAVRTKALAGEHKSFANDAPRTPPRKLRQFTRKASRFPKPFSQRFSHRPIKHSSTTPRRTHLPILTNHDGALILLQLAGVF